MNRRWTWIAVQAYKGEERAAVQRVARQDVQAYLPLIKREDGKRIIPMFAEYFFARWTPEWTRIRNTRGVAAVVMAGSVPGIIPNRFVRELQARENVRGIVELDDVPPSRLPTQLFSDGQSVIPRSGSFLGKTGIVKGQEGDFVRVLFTLLGREAQAEFSSDDLQAA